MTQIATGKEFAVKTMNKKHIVKEGKIDQIKLERNVLNLLDHPNIMKLFCTFQDAENLCTLQAFSLVSPVLVWC